MDLKKTFLPVLLLIVIPLALPAQYAYFPNDINSIKELNVKRERIRYSERLGDTSIFETNIYDENANLIQYKSKENMPIQAKIIFHYDDENFCYKVDYYRNFIFYQYKEIKKTSNKQIERYYSISGKYKGIQQTTSYNDQGQEEKLVIKRKRHPKVTRKYFYHDNGNLKQMWVKKDGKTSVTDFNLNGERLGGKKNKEIPKQILASYEDEAVQLELRKFTVSDILPEEIIKVGRGHQREYSMEMYTYFLPNGLNDLTQICIEDRLMYTYFFDYTFYGSDESEMVSIE